MITLGSPISSPISNRHCGLNKGSLEQHSIFFFNFQQNIVNFFLNSTLKSKKKWQSIGKTISNEEKWVCTYLGLPDKICFNFSLIVMIPIDRKTIRGIWKWVANKMLAIGMPTKIYVLAVWVKIVVRCDLVLICLINFIMDV